MSKDGWVKNNNLVEGAQLMRLGQAHRISSPDCLSTIISAHSAFHAIQQINVHFLEKVAVGICGLPSENDQAHIISVQPR